MTPLHIHDFFNLLEFLAKKSNGVHDNIEFRDSLGIRTHDLNNIIIAKV